MKYDARYVASHIPPDFVSDGCSGAPDLFLGYDLTPACRAHDAGYCQRLWPAGACDQEWRTAVDHQLGIEVRAALPLGLRWIGWLYWRAVHVFGGETSFASCGPLAGDLCRHNVARREWML